MRKTFDTVVSCLLPPASRLHRRLAKPPALLDQVERAALHLVVDPAQVLAARRVQAGGDGDLEAEVAGQDVETA
jgi:hypothetical protein